MCLLLLMFLALTSIVMPIFQMGNFTNVVDDVVEDRPTIPSLAELEKEEVCPIHPHCAAFKVCKQFPAFSFGCCLGGGAWRHVWGCRCGKRRRWCSGGQSREYQRSSERRYECHSKWHEFDGWERDWFVWDTHTSAMISIFWVHAMWHASIFGLLPLKLIVFDLLQTRTASSNPTWSTRSSGWWAAARPWPTLPSTTQVRWLCNVWRGNIWLLWCLKQIECPYPIIAFCCLTGYPHMQSLMEHKNLSRILVLLFAMIILAITGP